MGWWFDLAGPQDITYGLNWENVAPRLTRMNWKTKAVFRANVYIWIARARLHEKGKKERTSRYVKIRVGCKTILKRQTSRVSFNRISSRRVV